MAKIVSKTVATGTITLNGVSSGVVASINTTNVLGHNLDNCLIFVEGTLLCSSSTGKVAVHIGHATFKKINGTITAPAQMSGIDKQLEEQPQMAGAITFSLDIVGNIINFTVNNTSALNITVEGWMDINIAFPGATFIDNLKTFL